MGSQVAELTTNSKAILEKRYLDGGTVDHLWDRVSGGNHRFRELMSSLRFLPNSPTLFNAGTGNGCTLSACFVFSIKDSMFGPSSITETRNKAIAVAKAGGGVGYYFGHLRPKGSPIKTIQRVACGPVSVLRDYNAIAKLITQGGKRELAQMGVLPVSHPDAEEFIHCKDADPQGLGSFNISLSWKGDNIRDAHGDAAHEPRDKYSKLWVEQCKAAWAHGCPGMFFPDTANKSNPNLHLGLMEATNPCGETPNRSDEPCNLGSLSLPRYFLKGNRSIDWKLLEEDIWTATEFLDHILDINVFPHLDITNASLLTRKLGLGVMGWADLLALMHIHYDTNEALSLAHKVMGLIEEVSHAASNEMAQEKRPYKGYSDLTEGDCRRNETTTSIAPTGTISIIAGVWGSIEPHYLLRCNRKTNEGMDLQDGIPDWIWDQLDGFIPKVASEIAPEWHVKHQAAFQAHTDLGVSKTVNLPNSATVEDVSKIYRMMYENGCKGGTVFRDGCRSEQVLTAVKTTSVYSTDQKGSNGTPPPTACTEAPISNPPFTPSVTASAAEAVVKQLASLESKISKQVKLPTERKGRTVKFKVGGTNLFLTTGDYLDGRLGEIFINGNFGSTMAGLLNAFCISFSVSLQGGVPLEDLICHHINTRFEPSGMTDNPDVPVCTSVADLIVRWLRAKYLPHLHKSSKVVVDKTDSGAFCPDCGAECMFIGGCLTCPAGGCGYSRCG